MSRAAHKLHESIASPISIIENAAPAKPFLKWAGGKGQLLKKLEKRFPKELADGQITKYFEPFVGGGAVFFLIASRYKHNLKHIYLNDYNSSLILVYKVIQSDVNRLIFELLNLGSMYSSMSPDNRLEFYYNVRDEYNNRLNGKNLKNCLKGCASIAAKIIFLNKTCFNGLYRENRKGQFNVPSGRYENPTILDEDNLRAVSKSLERVNIESTDFAAIKESVDSDSFVYFDPPYRPISKTANFTSYSKFEFDENQQLRLADFFIILDKQGAKLMLSNSDPKNVNSEDNFFEETYQGFRIDRVSATRMINCNASKRGSINELVITNY